MLKRAFIAGLLVTLVNVFVIPMSMAKQLVVDAGTPLNLIVKNQLSSEDTVIGQKASFEVADDITVNDSVVIPKGSQVKGVVSSMS